MRVAGILTVAVLAGCTGGTAAPAATSQLGSVPVITDVVVPTTSAVVPATMPPESTITTTSLPATTTTAAATTSTTTTTTTTVPPPTVIDPADARSIPTDVTVEIGRSVEGRPITVMRRGDPTGGRILVVGAIHGNEDAGVAVVERLERLPVPEGVEWWLVGSINPDGQAMRTRQNAHQVDLNRNFPYRWGPLGQPGDWQYGGEEPASEPETQVMVALGAAINPDLIVWYHQDLNRIGPASGRAGEVRARYAELVGLPLIEVTGGTYTGTAYQWATTVVTDTGMSMTVELGETLSEAEADTHAAAMLTVAQEFFAGPSPG